jgi:hypothetical protein
MAVWKFKSCPRCNGDLFVQHEIDGWYEECLSCGIREMFQIWLRQTLLGELSNGSISDHKGDYNDFGSKPKKNNRR